MDDVDRRDLGCRQSAAEPGKWWQCQFWEHMDKDTGYWKPLSSNPVDPLTPSSLILKYTYKYLQYNGKSYQFMETPKLQTWIIPWIIGITGARP